LDRLGCGDGEWEALRVGVADIFGGQDDDPPGDEHRVLPRLDHARQVVQRRVWVSTAHALYERADDVVVFLAPVPQGPGPHYPLDIPHLDPPRPRGMSSLQRVQQTPPVTTGEAQQVRSSLGRDLDL
jgi:hypothetical protein